MQEITRQCTWRHKGAVSKHQCTWRRTSARDHAAIRVTSQRRCQQAPYARCVIRVQEMTRQCAWRHKGAVSKRQCTRRRTGARYHAAMHVTSHRRGQQAPMHVTSYGCKRSRGNCMWRHKGAVSTQQCTIRSWKTEKQKTLHLGNQSMQANDSPWEPFIYTCLKREKKTFSYDYTQLLCGYGVISISIIFFEFISYKYFQSRSFSSLYLFIEIFLEYKFSSNFFLGIIYIFCPPTETKQRCCILKRCLHICFRFCLICIAVVLVFLSTPSPSTGSFLYSFKVSLNAYHNACVN